MIMFLLFTTLSLLFSLHDSTIFYSYFKYYHVLTNMQFIVAACPVLFGVSQLLRQFLPKENTGHHQELLFKDIPW